MEEKKDRERQVTFRMDATTFQEFKKLCIDRDSTVKDQLIRLIENELNKERSNDNE